MLMHTKVIKISDSPGRLQSGRKVRERPLSRIAGCLTRNTVELRGLRE